MLPVINWDMHIIFVGGVVDVCASEKDHTSKYNVVCMRMKKIILFFITENFFYGNKYTHLS